MTDKNSMWSAQVTEPLDEKSEGYRQERGLSKSEAVRQILRSGIDSEPWYLRTLEISTGVSNVAVAFLASLAASGHSGLVPGVIMMGALTLVFNAELYRLEWAMNNHA